MKKLKLMALELGTKEVLTREQLKKVVGGDYGSGDDSGGCTSCTNDESCGSKETACGTAKGSCLDVAGQGRCCRYIKIC